MGNGKYSCLQGNVDYPAQRLYSIHDARTPELIPVSIPGRPWPKVTILERVLRNQRYRLPATARAGHGPALAAREAGPKARRPQPQEETTLEETEMATPERSLSTR
jgi:hypothetical protein